MQLVALGQPVIGSSDEVERPRSSAAGVCDEGVALGARAYCDLACAVDPSDGAHTCGERLTRGERGALSLDVAGLRELELVVNGCAVSGGGWALHDERGAAVVAEGAAIEVRSADGELVHREGERASAGECAERSVVLQDGRLELVQSDRRLCGEGLPRLPSAGLAGRWTLRLGEGVRALELCLRRARPVGG